MPSRFFEATGRSKWLLGRTFGAHNGCSAAPSMPGFRARGLGPGSSTGLVEATITRVAPKRLGKKESSRQKGKQQAKKKAAGKKESSRHFLKYQAFSEVPGIS